MNEKAYKFVTEEELGGDLNDSDIVGPGAQRLLRLAIQAMTERDAALAVAIDIQEARLCEIACSTEEVDCAGKMAKESVEAEVVRHLGWKA